MSDDRDEHKTDAIFTHLRFIKEGVERVETRLDAQGARMEARFDEQNGRMRTNEKAIAVLQWAMGLIGACSLSAMGIVLWRLVR